MLEPSFHDPQIEVVIKTGRHQQVLPRLVAAGFRPVLATPPIDNETSVPLLIDLVSFAEPDGALFSFPDLRDVSRPVIFLGQLPPGRRPASDHIHLPSAELIANLPARLDLRRRTMLRENERRLRLETERTFGSPLYFDGQAKAASAPKILYVGPIGARFLPLSRQLAARGTEVVASMTLQTASMHLDAERFRLVVVDPSCASADVEQLKEGRGDLPVYVVGDDAGSAFDGCVDIDGDCETAYDLLADRAKSIPLCTRLDKVRLGATSHDPLTGLYSEAFLRAHLQRQMRACSALETPLTLLHLRSRDGAIGSHDLVCLSKLIVASLRETDLVARMSPSSFVVALRDTPYSGAVNLTRRLFAAIDKHPQLGADMAERLGWRAVERRGSYTPEGLLSAVLEGPHSQAIAA